MAKLKDADAWVAVRLAPRYGFSEPIAVQVNGTASQLCDLSIGGCQVLSQTALKPNQTVKVTIPGTPKAISCSGKIVWAKLESARARKTRRLPCRRAISRSPISPRIEAFILGHRATAQR